MMFYTLRNAVFSYVLPQNAITFFGQSMNNASLTVRFTHCFLFENSRDNIVFFSIIPCKYVLFLSLKS